MSRQISPMAGASRFSPRSESLFVVDHAYRIAAGICHGHITSHPAKRQARRDFNSTGNSIFTLPSVRLTIVTVPSLANAGAPASTRTVVPRPAGPTRSPFPGRCPPQLLTYAFIRSQHDIERRDAGIPQCAKPRLSPRRSPRACSPDSTPRKAAAHPRDTASPDGISALRFGAFASGKTMSRCAETLPCSTANTFTSPLTFDTKMRVPSGENTRPVKLSCAPAVRLRFHARRHRRNVARHLRAGSGATGLPGKVTFCKTAPVFGSRTMISFVFPAVTKSLRIRAQRDGLRTDARQLDLNSRRREDLIRRRVIAIEADFPDAVVGGKIRRLRRCGWLERRLARDCSEGAANERGAKPARGQGMRGHGERMQMRAVGLSIAGEGSGSIRVPRVGRGVPPRRTFSTLRFAIRSRNQCRSVREVREGGTPSPTRGTRMLPGVLQRVDSLALRQG